MTAPSVSQWTVPGYADSRELGSGASGRVVLATHEGTGTPVAIKYLNDTMRRDGSFLAGFRAEARLLNTFTSPYVVRLYEYVEDARGAAIVMELVDGIPLRALLRQEGPTGPEAALTVLKGSLLGLAAAHAAGVVHRDYKPDNVLVAADGSSILVDFGIAVPVGEAPDVSGTPPYMAPEQWMGYPAGPATDVYAATATFFECLTGARPYAGDTAIQLAMQHMHAPIPGDAVPEQVRSLVLRGLAKSPAERPANAATFVHELNTIAVAGYGEDWEERGQRKLAALVALLPLLFPSAGGGASGTTALATTTLGSGVGRRLRQGLKGKALAGSAAVALLVGGVAVTVVAASHNSGLRLTAGKSPATGGPSTVPVGAEPVNAAGPGQSASTQPAASPQGSQAAGSTPGDTSGSGGSGGSATAKATSGSTAESTSGGTSPTGGATAGGSSPTSASSPTTSKPPGSTAGPTAKASPPAPQLKVISAEIVASGPLGNDCTMVASVTVTTDGAADGTLTLSWFHGTSSRAVGTIVATEPVPLPEGKTQISQRYTHTFAVPDRNPYLGLQISTSPDAESGNGSFATIPAPSSCDPVR
ncbi:MAG TPA: protein kinase [Kineosporiaceae bacterium]|nr:protein kinase [Kineosporiaceae bacterium]